MLCTQQPYVRHDERDHDVESNPDPGRAVRMACDQDTSLVDRGQYDTDDNGNRDSAAEMLRASADSHSRAKPAPPCLRLAASTAASVGLHTSRHHRVIVTDHSTLRLPDSHTYRPGHLASNGRGAPNLGNPDEKPLERLLTATLLVGAGPLPGTQVAKQVRQCPRSP